MKKGKKATRKGKGKSDKSSEKRGTRKTRPKNRQGDVGGKKGADWESNAPPTIAVSTNGSGKFRKKRRNVKKVKNELASEKTGWTSRFFFVILTTDDVKRAEDVLSARWEASSILLKKMKNGTARRLARGEKFCERRR